MPHCGHEKRGDSTENPDLRSDYTREVQDMLRAICKRLKLLLICLCTI
jgi:hypothetical protein